MTEIRRLLIANRGEIVSRIARTARSMGIETVGVFADSDTHAAYLRDVDFSVATGADPYLDIVALLGAASAAGADAVHPGYGFLSENADFARAVLDRGLIWVGPPPAAILAMGRKVEAKAAAARAGVPILSGITIAAGGSDLSGVVDLGLPLLVKPSAGGGGKGMHRVDDLADLPTVVAAAQREAVAAFGDATLFVERFIETGRHVEVQIFADRYGTVRLLGERDCSVQRRHQKVIEESPAVGLSDELRAEMAAAAERLTRELGYLGAGTLEFLVFDDRFAFLEMNTRLQVEHAVTEEVTGVDLVEWQLEVAAGMALPPAPAPVGHAVEARLYAEDPAREFMPSPGLVTDLRHDESPGVRWEWTVGAGSAVNSRYDPMIAKVIASGRDRRQAVQRLVGALRGLRIDGVVTNRAMLLAILTSDEFRAGAVGTDFLTRRPDLLVGDEPADRLSVLAAATIHGCLQRRSAARIQPFTPPGWRNLHSQDAQSGHGLGYRRCGEDTWVVTLDGTEHPVRVHGVNAGSIDLEIASVRRTYRLRTDGADIIVESGGGYTRLHPADRGGSDAAGAADSVATAPIPGVVVAVDVASGDVVEQGQTLLVLEAMKMEHRITATAPATIGRILVAVGDTVDYQQPLIHIDSVATP
ncbi:MAG TPA: biotin carboxylase N-terminal domain-containing protein [Micromonosporaceae bacterium]